MMSRSKDYSEQTAQEIDAEVKRIIDEANNTAKELITTNRDKLEMIANALLEYETLDGAQVDGNHADRKFHAAATVTGSHRADDGRARRDAAAGDAAQTRAAEIARPRFRRARAGVELPATGFNTATLFITGVALAAALHLTAWWNLGAEPRFVVVRAHLPKFASPSKSTKSIAAKRARSSKGGFSLMFGPFAATKTVKPLQPASKGRKRFKWLKASVLESAWNFGDSGGKPQEFGGKCWDFRGKSGTPQERAGISGEHAARRGNALGMRGKIRGIPGKLPGQPGNGREFAGTRGRKREMC